MQTDNQPTPPPAAQPAPAPAPDSTLNPKPTCVEPAKIPAGPGIISAETTANQSLATVEQQPVTIIDATNLPATRERRKSRRTGRIALLPKLQRDSVGRMVANGVPYKNIVHAIDECGFTITERNISTWVTGGGYNEWRLEQELALQTRLDQDHLVDHLRRDDATELPEVGLQAIATRLSQSLLRKTAQGENIKANLDAISREVDILSRITQQIAILQKQRDDDRRALGCAHDPVRVKDMDQITARNHERFYSNPPADSGLPKPAEPPLLPPQPTSDFIAQCDREDEEARKLKNMAELQATLQAFNGKNGTGAPAPKTLPPSPAR
jgi:hypothetical protein